MSGFDADVIVVGAGPSGCAAAYDLVSAGFSVLLLDKKTFPRFKACAGGLTIKTLNRLRYEVKPVIRTVHSDFVAGLAGGERVTFNSNPICALTVREEFDEFCLKQTIAHGAKFQNIDGIETLITTINGVELKTKSGEVLKAKYVIGADGAHSQVRKLTGLFKPEQWAVAIEGVIPVSKLKEIPKFTFDFYAVEQGYGWLFPKGDHVNVGLYKQHGHHGAISKAALKEYALKTLGTDELDKIVGFPIATEGEWQVPADDRVLLVGDAAGFAEALLGEGLHNAVLSGQHGAAAIIRASKGESLIAAYTDLTLNLRRDIYNCRIVANVFYGLPKGGSWLLKKYFGQKMMTGMSEGRTLSETFFKSRFN